MLWTKKITKSLIIKKLFSKKKKKIGLSIFQSKRKKEKFKIINDYDKKIKELIRIKIYDPKIINRVVKEFLSRFYKLKLGFTPKEFDEKINNKDIRKDTKRRLLIFLENLDNLLYGNNSITEENAGIMMEDFLLIIEDLKEDQKFIFQKFL